MHWQWQLALHLIRQSKQPAVMCMLQPIMPPAPPCAYEAAIHNLTSCAACPAAFAPIKPGVRHTVRRTVQPTPPFEDTQLPEDDAACVLLTCRPGVVVPSAEQSEGMPKVVVQEEVVACLPLEDTAVEARQA